MEGERREGRESEREKEDAEMRLREVPFFFLPLRLHDFVSTRFSFFSGICFLLFGRSARQIKKTAAHLQIAIVSVENKEISRLCLSAGTERN